LDPAEADAAHARGVSDTSIGKAEMNGHVNGTMDGMNRSLSMALLAAFVAATLGGACSSSSTTAKPDGGGGDHPTSSNVVAGTIDSSGTPPCITQPLMLMGGQAQCTVVEHRTATGGVIDTALPSCDTVSQGPCWSLVTSPGSCPGGGLTFTFDPDPADPNPNPSTLSYDYSCALRTN
jgi:hypothetical protein